MVQRQRTSKIYKKITLSHFAYSAFIGTLLGDTHLGKHPLGFEASGNFAHSLKQEGYALHKVELFKDLTGSVFYKHNEDKRTHKVYSAVFKQFNCNPFLTELHKIFYVDRVKIIPEFVYSVFNEISLAYLFMDDGSHHKNGYYISLCNFTLEELKSFCVFLTTRFNLKCSIHRQKQIYIWKESTQHFNNLVSPYILDELKYKLI